MKKIRKATPVTIALKRITLLPSQLASVVTGGGKGETHTNQPQSQNLTHRVQPS